MVCLLDLQNLINVPKDFLRRLVQEVRVLHQALHVFEDRGVVETVYNPLIQAELQVHILPLDHGTVGQDLIGPPFAAEGAENRQIAEIIQMVINGGNPQRAHGGEKYGAVEGLAGAGSLNLYVRKTGDRIRLLFKADKLLEIVSAVANMTQNATVNAIGKVASAYDGMLLGCELTPKE